MGFTAENFDTSADTAHHVLLKLLVLAGSIHMLNALVAIQVDLFTLLDVRILDLLKNKLQELKVILLIVHFDDLQGKLRL